MKRLTAILVLFLTAGCDSGEPAKVGATVAEIEARKASIIAEFERKGGNDVSYLRATLAKIMEQGGVDFDYQEVMEDELNYRKNDETLGVRFLRMESGQKYLLDRFIEFSKMCKNSPGLQKRIKP